MKQQSPEERQVAVRPVNNRRAQRKARLAQEQKLVFAAIFLISLIVISPFLIHGLVKQNQQKKLALSQQAAVTVQSQKAGQSTNSRAAILPSSTSPADKNFFDNTLFIGDSRTVGLKEYAGIEGADFLCDVGLDSQKAMKGNLPGMLASHKYRRIYIMLGINEIGNPRQTVLKHFRTLVQYVKNHEPGAQIILMGNLHVTAKKAASDTFFSNSNIDGLNSQISQIASSCGCRYLDPNPPFDDGTGALPEKYSGDGAHLYGKYYTLWKNWIVAQR